ncbi:MAG TPA: CRISPR-associated protein Cas4 [Ktedonobacteraceae bacterium]
MTDVSHGEAIPISALNALEYCPRKFYYQFVQGETLANEFVLEGQLAHRRVHQAGTHVTKEGEIETTRLYLFSEALRLTGFADVTEERAGVLIPVEYKRGQQGDWLGDQIQLCAQALCLEERQSDKQPIPHGYIYYIGSRRRVRIPFTEELRARTRETIAQALQVAASETAPPPLAGKLVARCPSCSLFPLCLPEEVRLLQAKRR